MSAYSEVTFEDRMSSSIDPLFVTIRQRTDGKRILSTETLLQLINHKEPANFFVGLQSSYTGLSGRAKVGSVLYRTELCVGMVYRLSLKDEFDRVASPLSPPLNHHDHYQRGHYCTLLSGLCRCNQVQAMRLAPLLDGALPSQPPSPQKNKPPSLEPPSVQTVF